MIAEFIFFILICLKRKTSNNYIKINKIKIKSYK